MLNNSTSCHCFAIFYTVVYCSFHIYNRAVNVHVNMVYFGNVDYVRYLSVSINNHKYMYSKTRNGKADVF